MKLGGRPLCRSPVEQHAHRHVLTEYIRKQPQVDSEDEVRSVLRIWGRQHKTIKTVWHEEVHHLLLWPQGTRFLMTTCFPVSPVSHGQNTSCRSSVRHRFFAPYTWMVDDSFFHRLAHRRWFISYSESLSVHTCMSGAFEPKDNVNAQRRVCMFGYFTRLDFCRASG